MKGVAEAVRCPRPVCPALCRRLELCRTPPPVPTTLFGRLQGQQGVPTSRPPTQSTPGPPYDARHRDLKVAGEAAQREEEEVGREALGTASKAAAEKTAAAADPIDLEAGARDPTSSQAPSAIWAEGAAFAPSSSGALSCFGFRVSGFGFRVSGDVFRVSELGGTAGRQTSAPSGSQVSCRFVRRAPDHTKL